MGIGRNEHGQNRYVSEEGREDGGGPSGDGLDARLGAAGGGMPERQDRGPATVLDQLGRLRRGARPDRRSRSAPQQPPVGQSERRTHRGLRSAARSAGG